MTVAVCTRVCVLVTCFPHSALAVLFWRESPLRIGSENTCTFSQCCSKIDSNPSAPCSVKVTCRRAPIFLFTCKCEKRGNAGWSSCSRLPLILFPHPSLPTAFSCLCPDSGWWRCSRDWGLSLRLSLPPHSLSLSLHKWRLSVFIVQRVTRHPANGGLPRPRWTSRA